MGFWKGRKCVYIVLRLASRRYFGDWIRNSFTCVPPFCLHPLRLQPPIQRSYDSPSEDYKSSSCPHNSQMSSPKALENVLMDWQSWDHTVCNCVPPPYIHFWHSDYRFPRPLNSGALGTPWYFHLAKEECDSAFVLDSKCLCHNLVVSPFHGLVIKFGMKSILITSQVLAPGRGKGVK